MLGFPIYAIFNYNSCIVLTGSSSSWGRSGGIHKMNLNNMDAYTRALQEWSCQYKQEILCTDCSHTYTPRGSSRASEHPLIGTDCKMNSCHNRHSVKQPLLWLYGELLLLCQNQWRLPWAFYACISSEISLMYVKYIIISFVIRFKERSSLSRTSVYFFHMRTLHSGRCFSKPGSQKCASLYVNCAWHLTS